MGENNSLKPRLSNQITNGTPHHTYRYPASITTNTYTTLSSAI